MRGEQLITTWLNVVDRVSPTTYVQISDFSQLPASVLGGSSLWAQRFFSAEADPHRQKTKVKLRVHLSTVDSPDLLVYDYDLKSWHLSVTESNNFTLIRVAGNTDFCALSEDKRREFVQTAARQILNLEDDEHHWSFELPDKLGDKVIFSTKSDVDPLYLPQWSDRADGGIHRGVLFFLCYKKVLQVAGYADIKAWFDEDFRVKVAH